MKTSKIKKVNDKVQNEENYNFNAETLEAIEEGLKMMNDPNAKRFKSIEELIEDCLKD